MNLWPTIYNWLISQTDRPVIRRDQNGGLPDRTFVTAKITTDAREGQPFVGKIDDEGVIKVQQGAILTLTMQVFGPGALEIAQAIRNSTGKPSVQAFLRANGLCYVRTLSGPTDITTIVGTSFEERASIDVQLRTNMVVLDNVGFIERVELTGIVPPLEYTDIIDVAVLGEN